MVKGKNEEVGITAWLKGIAGLQVELGPQTNAGQTSTAKNRKP